MFSMLRTNRDIRLLFIAQVISFAGDWFAYVAFVGLVNDLSSAATLVTMVYVAQALPAFLMAPIAGPAADRFDRRRIIRTVSLGQALAALGLLFVGSTGSLWFGFLCLCVISALGSFVGPSAQAGLPNLARTPVELTKAALLFGSLWGAMLAVGAALGGLVASVFGRDVAFAANAVSFVLAAASVSLIRRPMQAERAPDAPAAPRMRPIADMHEAFSYARKDNVILALLASKATFAMGAGIVGLLAVLATDELNGGDAATGLLIGARGVGVALGPLIAARFVGPSMSRVLLMCGAAAMSFGVCYLGLSLAPTLAVALPFAFLAHIGGGAQWTLSTYGLQRRAPDAIRGRILAGDFGIVTLIITLSNLGAGALADAVGARPTIAVFAVLGLLAGALYLWLTRGVREQLAVEHRLSLESVAPAPS
ncbi:MAG: MFS transporter [Ilumatobacteraceae bacterium]